MNRSAGLLLVALCSCERGQPAATPQGAGARLERAAIAAGVVPDAGRLDPVGVFGIEGDKVCVVPRPGGYTVGATVRYDDEQACIARGTATGRAKLAVNFGGGCRLDAAFDGEHITFPAIVPAQCDRVCTGRASLSALSTPRLSYAASEASALHAEDGRSLCPG